MECLHVWESKKWSKRGRVKFQKLIAGVVLLFFMARGKGVLSFSEWSTGGPHLRLWRANFVSRNRVFRGVRNPPKRNPPKRAPPPALKNQSQNQ